MTESSVDGAVKDGEAKDWYLHRCLMVHQGGRVDGTALLSGKSSHGGRLSHGQDTLVTNTNDIRRRGEIEGGSRADGSGGEDQLRRGDDWWQSDFMYSLG